jgi:hypothetical protein
MLDRSSLALVLLAAVLLPTGALAQKPAAPAPTPASDAHKALAAFVGEFDQHTEVRMGPGEPQKFHSTSTGAWILGGQFVQVASRSAPDEKQQGERMLIYGFDPQSRKYTLANYETGAMVATIATGDYDAASRTFTFTGERPQGPAKIPFRWTLKVDDKGAIQQTIAMKFPGAADYAPCITVQHTPKAKIGR